jgi:hypothetical protein
MRFATGDAEVLEAGAAVCADTEALARDRRVDELSAQGAEALMDLVIRNERANTALKLRLAARFAENHGAKAADDLAKKTGTSKGKAKRTVETAKKLKDQPEVEDALRNGELSEDQAELIADAVDANPSAAGGLLKKARDHPIDDLRQECGRAKAAADGDEDATHARIHRNRSWRTGTNADGAFWGSALGTTVDGADFSAHLQPFRERVFNRNRKAGIFLTSEQTDFDALMEMARTAYQNVTGTPTPEAADGDEAIPMPPPAPKGPKTVYIVANWDAMVGRAEPGEESAYIAGFGNVPISVVREVMDDAFLVGVVMKGTEVAKIKRFGRRFGQEIRDAVMIKHRFRCSTPGCTNWAYLEMDHVHPTARTGRPTSRTATPNASPATSSRPNKTASPGTTRDDAERSSLEVGEVGLGGLQRGSRPVDLRLCARQCLLGVGQRLRGGVPLLLRLGGARFGVAQHGGRLVDLLLEAGPLTIVLLRRLLLVVVGRFRRGAESEAEASAALGQIEQAPLLERGERGVVAADREEGVRDLTEVRRPGLVERVDGGGSRALHRGAEALVRVAELRSTARRHGACRLRERCRGTRVGDGQPVQRADHAARSTPGLDDRRLLLVPVRLQLADERVAPGDELLDRR